MPDQPFANSPGPTDDEILAGGVELAVRHLGPGKSPETIFVRLVPVAEYPALRTGLLDEPRAAEIYAGKPEGWARTLSPASHTELITMGRRLNDAFFGPWLARQNAVLAWIEPGREALMKQTAEAMARLLVEASSATPSAPLSPAV